MPLPLVSDEMTATVPASAALTGVPAGAAMSMPWFLALS